MGIVRNDAPRRGRLSIRRGLALLALAAASLAPVASVWAAGAGLDPEPDLGFALPGVEVWRADYEDGFAGWRGLHGVGPRNPPYLGGDQPTPGVCRGRGTFAGEDRIQIVSSPVRQGRYAARFVVYNGDKPICAAGDRAMHLRPGVNESEGDESWYQWSTMLAPGFPRITHGWQLLVEWHGPGGDSQAPVALFAHGDRIGFKTVEHDERGRPLPSKVHWMGPMARGRWHDFVAHIRWSWHRKVGFVELWHRLEVDVRYSRVVGKTYRRTLVYPGRGNYFVPGYYRSPNAGPPGVVYHDGWVQTRVKPEGRSSP